ncbi:uncharacterized protein LOC119611026 isoform X1 [Lucilia sericata]|uniref:uncharacterized protein LOC119611026 isoform X1 n=2 Tax=Lucilia sericata TaxID=13632 RepID=UPI0018A84DC9|nr:uncharacterized protein LOC119611026 isoform X1 [Lucilia sericata]
MFIIEVKMAIKKWILSIAILIGITTIIEAKFGDKLSIKEKDLMQKAIVFDKKTPDLFYCPTQKPSAMNKLIVRSRPLHKLCEYEGRQLPDDYKSDCYEDIDESNYACKEKYRIMMRKYPPGSEEPFNGTRLHKFMKMDLSINTNRMNKY